MWLNICSGSVPAGHPTPLSEQAKELVDINGYLIRNEIATYIFRVKGKGLERGCWRMSQSLLQEINSSVSNHLKTDSAYLAGRVLGRRGGATLGFWAKFRSSGRILKRICAPNFL